jgi:hypothetical protein
MPLDKDQQEQYISIWAKAVDTQMHFNEMCVKSRQLGLTFVTAALGVAIVLLSRGDAFSFPIPFRGVDFQLHISVVILLGAWLALSAVRTLDLNVYHKMLRGAVTFGEDFEQHYMKQIFDLDKGMTQAISHFSRRQDAGKEIVPETGKYRTPARVKSARKTRFDHSTKGQHGFCGSELLRSYCLRMSRQSISSQT